MSIEEIFGSWFGHYGMDWSKLLYIVLMGVICLALGMSVVFIVKVITKKHNKINVFDKINMIMGTTAVLFMITLCATVIYDINHGNDNREELIALTESKETTKACSAFVDEIDISGYSLNEEEIRQAERYNAATKSLYPLGAGILPDKKVRGNSLLSETNNIIHVKDEGYYLDCYRVLANADVDKEFTTLVEEAYLLEGKLPERKGM